MSGVRQISARILAYNIISLCFETAVSGVPSQSAARGADLKCRPIRPIYTSIRPTVIVGFYIKSKKGETEKITI